MSRYLGPKLKRKRSFEIVQYKKKKTTRKKKKFKFIRESKYLPLLKEKQKMRFYYGLTNKQLSNYLHIYLKIKELKMHKLCNFLEMRLDNIIFKLSLSKTISEARQFINHKHILVNNSPVNIPSFICKTADKITLLNLNKKTIKIPKTLPKKIDKKKLNFLFNEHKISEYYLNKKIKK
uniref:ribosomal protein S4 n=1 Tax=Prosopanche panguanensis TaxID=2952649 RepID=UPI002114E019|nr:ribosomal protein S4 [Prosopanche panguanensis]USN93700.1 ribosomal protein S4 [Prosopanche panguanensis]